MPSATKRRIPVPRGKTYHGCWTCRARHVKCDAVRPSCQRCAKSKLSCEGYDIRLSWDRHEGTETPPTRKTRIYFSEDDMSNPVFNPQQIESALENLDTVDAGFDGFRAGPFTVFSADLGLVTNPNNGDISPLQDVVFSSPTSGSSLDSDVTVCEQREHTHHLDALPENFSTGKEDAPHLKDESSTTSSMTVTQGRLAPLLQPFIAASSSEDRQLFHFWVTSASTLMISTGHPDNPYRHIYVPLAMAALGTGRHLVGNRALLHSIYAFAASNMAQLHNTDTATRYHELAVKHHHVSLAYLRQSLLVDDAEQHGATLGAIVLLTSMDIVNGESTHWRIHLRGGRTWLNSIASTWQKITDNQIIYQVFRGLEIFGYSHDQNKLLDSSFDKPGCIASLPTATTLESSFYRGGENLYQMEKLFGITKPVLDAILTINRLTREGYTPTPEELDELSTLILMANPCTLRFPSPTVDLERLTRHHACAFYFACVIYEKRSLLHWCPADVQYIVEYSLTHLEEIADTEVKTGLVAAGLLWPLFVTAAEASNDNVRRRFIAVFASRKRQGIAAVSQIQDVVQEIWRQRDHSSHPSEVYRHKVMEELGIDVLLT